MSDTAYIYKQSTGKMCIQSAELQLKACSNTELLVAVLWQASEWICRPPPCTAQHVPWGYLSWPACSFWHCHGSSSPPTPQQQCSRAGKHCNNGTNFFWSFLVSSVLCQGPVKATNRKTGCQTHACIHLHVHASSSALLPSSLTIKTAAAAILS